MNRILHRTAALAVALLTAGLATAGSYDDYFDAIVRDDPNAVRALLARGFDPNTVDKDGRTGLYVALRRDSLRAAEAIASSPELKPNLLNEVGESALMMAALRGREELVKRLIERGADVNKSGWAPLHYAASGPSTEVLKLLIDKGADLDARSPNGTTPLMMAAGYGPEASVDALLAKGADPKRRNDLQLSAADFARRGSREALAKRLDALAP